MIICDKECQRALTREGGGAVTLSERCFFEGVEKIEREIGGHISGKACVAQSAALRHTGLYKEKKA